MGDETEMKKTGFSRNRMIRLVGIFMVLGLALLLCGCRSRITNLPDATTTVTDEEGVVADEYELRRYELDLYETKESIFSGLVSSSDSDEEEYDEEFDDVMEDYESSDYEDDYEEPEETSDDDNDDENGTTPSTTSPRTVTPYRRTTPTTTTPQTRRPSTTTPQTPQTPTYVTVTLDPNGGTVSYATKRVAVGSTYGTFPVPEKKGYTFEGWYTKQSEGKKITATSKVSKKKDHKLYARWKEIPEESYTITFDPNGGEIKSGDSAKVLHNGDKYGSFPGVMLDGYKLKGWYTSADGGKQVSESTKFTAKKDITLYAQWEYDPYKYWSGQMASVSISDDSKFDCYVETDDNVTSSKNSLLNSAQLGNVAGSKDKNVDDAWILDKDPAYIIKIVDGGKDTEKVANNLLNRFKDARDNILAENPDIDPGSIPEITEDKIIVLPDSALNGSDNEKLYYTIYLNGKIYNTFTKEEIDKVKEELKIES